MKKTNTLGNVLSFVLIAVIVFGVWAVVTAVDRLRFAVESLEKQNASSSGVANLMRLRKGDASKSLYPAANSQYFDPAADEGGRMIAANGTDTGNMNYVINNEAMVAAFWDKTMDTLGERSWGDLSVFEGKLAESWIVSEDNLVYTIRLRKGILWHDFTDPVTGKEWKNVEVTAADFKFMLDVVMDENVDALPMRTYLAGIKEIKILDDHNFQVVWKEPYFLAMETTMSLMPLPRHFYAPDGKFDGAKFNTDDARNRMIVGCGPYRFVRWDKGTRVVFERFENYYGRDYGVMPPVKHVVYEIIQHPNTRLQALVSGDLDVDGLTPEQWTTKTNTPSFAEGGTLRKIKYPSPSYNYVGLNLKNPLFIDRRVRQALSMLIDRKRILHDVYHDLAQSVSGPFFAESPAYDKMVEPYGFSPEKARKLLADAGWRDSDGNGFLDKDGKEFTFTLMYPSVNTTYQRFAPILKEDMAKAGVRLELLAMEWSVMIQRLEEKNFDAAMLGWTSPITPDPFQLWHSSTADEKGSSNFISFRNSAADELIEKIRKCFDEKERLTLYHKFHRLIHEEAPYLFLFSPYSLEVISTRYENVRVFPMQVPESIMWVKKSRQLAVPGM